MLLFVSLFLEQERTRSALLESLYEELQIRSRSMMGLASGDEDKIENGGGGFFENFKVRDGVNTEFLNTLPYLLT